MPAIGKIKSKLKKAINGTIEITTDSNCLTLSGELERWTDVVKAGMIAADEKPKLNVVNDITSTADKPLPERKPRISDSKLDGEEPDVLVIGGGIIGCAVARELSKYNLTVLLAEKEHDVAVHATGHSLALAHSGAMLGRDTQKLWYTKLGIKKMESICDELGVPYNRSGQYIIFTNHFWHPFLPILRLYWRWIHGMKDIRVVKSDELKSLEPGLAPNCGTALFFPDAGFVPPHALAVAYAENSIQNGAVISLNTMVQEIEVQDETIVSVVTNRGTVKPKAVVNAAGALCEDIAAMAGDKFYSIHPLKGMNLVIDRKYSDSLVKSAVSVYGGARGRRKRSPENVTGILKTSYGNALAGPFYMESINKEDFSTDRFSVEKAVEQAKNLVPALESGHVLTYYAGIAAASYEGDFIISAGKNVKNMIHVAGIQFPGLTAAPAIAEDVARMTAELFGGERMLKPETEFIPRREASPVLGDMDLDERESWIAKDPDYGIIVCHCEQVSKGEIKDVLNRDLKCDSIDGVKQRTRACMGICQGQNCLHSVLEIIGHEKRYTLPHVRKSGSGSEVIVGIAGAVQEKKPGHAVPLVPKDEHEKDLLLADKIKQIEEAKESKGS